MGRMDIAPTNKCIFGTFLWGESGGGEGGSVAIVK